VNLTIRRTSTECESQVTVPSDHFSGYANVLETNFVGFARAVLD